ncbi:MAG: hypothetical protein KBC95_00570 [Candidatus Peribacteraceae bacterium]|nr:hypothetical protein [Candidatus Peribacteraceae bacterium]
MPTTLFVMRRLGVEDRGGRTLFVGVGDTPEEAAGYTALESGDPVLDVNFRVLKAVSLQAKARNYTNIAEVIERLQAFLGVLAEGDAVSGYDDFVNDFARLVCSATCDALGQ